MPYLIFSAMEYEESFGMADLVYFAKTEKELLSWAQANLPMASDYWVEIAEVTKDAYYDIDEDELLKGKVIRIKDL